MYRENYKQSRLRNWLALVLMAVAAIAAARTQASEIRTQPPHAVVQR